MATSIREERSTLVGGLSCLHLFLIVLCKGSYGVEVEWRCDENRWYSNERQLHSLILGIVGGDKYKYVTVLLKS